MTPAPGKRVEHGGDLSAIRARFPEAPEPWIDLSTGINPIPYPVPALSAEAWTRLPRRAQEEALIEAAARRYGVPDPATIIAAPGTQALIQALPRLLPPSRVAIIGPTYEEHEVCWRRQGHDVSTVADPGQAKEAEVVVVVNPDNPTGRLLAADEFPSPFKLMVVDEAFIDLLAPAYSLAGALPPRTVVLRSFGKTYGLAGLRLGFAIASHELAERLRSEFGPWAVSGPALEIGRAALDDDAWLSATADRLTTDRQRLDDILIEAGFVILGGTPLFCLARHREAPAMVERLGRHGIHVRSFRQQPTWLRFGIPDSDATFERLRTSIND
jgi:cobalamin biosynthetic protein CobC